MSTSTAHQHEHHASGGLTSMAISGTLHCLTGCAIGEILGMVIGTAAGLSNATTVVLSIALAFLFGYGLTSLPLLRGGFALAAVIPIALASDTLSIATMEAVDNALIVAIPGAMDAGLDTLLFWGSLSAALVIAGAVAVPVNRWLIARGKGHAVVHETGIHGGPPVRVVAAVAALAAAFGAAVLVNEAVNGDAGMGHGGGEHGAEAAAPVRGVAVAEGGMTLELGQTKFPRGRAGELSFRIAGAHDFELTHERRMHLIIVRRDLTGFQHLHPTMARDGTWTTPLKLDQAGSYRVFADFKTDGESHTLAGDLHVDGELRSKQLPAQSSVARTADGYEVELRGESELRFSVTRGGRPVTVEPYLGANGHLVALREGDLAFLHVHPEGGAFMTEFPSPGRYRLFLQFKHGGRVHTAAFTRLVVPAQG